MNVDRDCILSRYRNYYESGVYQVSGAMQGSSKVSKIATLFQEKSEIPSISQENRTYTDAVEAVKSEKDSHGSHITVVRTESHVARFNSARALFEKMGKSSQSGSESKVPQKGLINGKKPFVPKQHSEFSLETDQEDCNSQINGINAREITSTINKNLDSDKCLISSKVNNEQTVTKSPLYLKSDTFRASSKTSHDNDNNRSTVQKQNLFSDDSKVELVHEFQNSSSFISKSTNKIENKKENETHSRKVSYGNSDSTEEVKKPQKPVKPLSLKDIKPSQTYHQELLERHKNWFQSFSKQKSPLSSPSKNDSYVTCLVDRPTVSRNVSSEVLSPESSTVVSPNSCTDSKSFDKGNEEVEKGIEEDVSSFAEKYVDEICTHEESHMESNVVNAHSNCKSNSILLSENNLVSDNKMGIMVNAVCKNLPSTQVKKSVKSNESIIQMDIGSEKYTEEKQEFSVQDQSLNVDNFGTLECINNEISGLVEDKDATDKNLENYSLEDENKYEGDSFLSSTNGTDNTESLLRNYLTESFDGNKAILLETNDVLNTDSNNMSSSLRQLEDYDVKQENNNRLQQELEDIDSVKNMDIDIECSLNNEKSSPVLSIDNEISYDLTVTSAQYKLEDGHFETNNAKFEQLSNLNQETENNTHDFNEYFTEPEAMSPEEASHMLSVNRSESLLSEAEVQEITQFLSSNNEMLLDEKLLIDKEEEEPDTVVQESYIECSYQQEAYVDGILPRAKEIHIENGIHYLEDGHFWVEIPGLPEESAEEIHIIAPSYVHKSRKVKFSSAPIQVFSTYSYTEYDRKNEEVDPVAASAEYELEKRVEKMEIIPVEIYKGEAGLGLSIIGMGVGADAGVEKLGIFVKMITPGGATDQDGRIKVNDQIIEVDGKSFVGVTQMFAASVLKGTLGLVKFLIGREKDPENSEVALLIRQSLEADREREERRRALEGPDYSFQMNHNLYDPFSSPSENSLSEDVSSSQNVYDLEREELNAFNAHAEHQQSACDIPQSPFSPPHDADLDFLKMMLKELLEVEHECAKRQADQLDQLKEVVARLSEAEEKLVSKTEEINTFKNMLDESQGQHTILEKKYTKAKKIIKEYQTRERDFLHREEYHISQLEDKDAQYSFMIKELKERVVQLENKLTEFQNKAVLSSQGIADDTSSESTSHRPVISPPSPLSKNNIMAVPEKPHALQVEELSDDGPESSLLDDRDAQNVPPKEEFDIAVPPHELLDVSASRAKGELAAKGGLANRQLPSFKKQTSTTDISEMEEDNSQSDTKSSQSSLHPSCAAALQEQNISSVGSADQEKKNEHLQQQYIVTSQMSQSTSSSIPTTPPYISPPPYSAAIHHSSQSSFHKYSSHSTQPAPSASHHSSSYSSQSTSHNLSHQMFNSTYYGCDQRIGGSYRLPPPVARVLPVSRDEFSERADVPLSYITQQGSHQKSFDNTREHLENFNLPVNQESKISYKRYPTHESHSGAKVHQVSTSSMMPSVAVSSEHISSHSNLSARWERNIMHHSQKGEMMGGIPVMPGIIPHSNNEQRSPQSDLDAGYHCQQPHELHLMTCDNGGELSSGPTSLGSGDESPATSLESNISPSHEGSRDHTAIWEIIPVCDWTEKQVSQWLISQGLESCVAKFSASYITGPRLINLDAKDLKNLSISNDDKNKLKRKVKELRLAMERERKVVEKEKKEKEKLQKKAEKLAEKADKRRK